MMLKPCPFCGSNDVDVMKKVYETGATTYHVMCHNCTACSGICLTESGAVQAWNTRVIPQSISPEREQKEDT